MVSDVQALRRQIYLNQQFIQQSQYISIIIDYTDGGGTLPLSGMIVNIPRRSIRRYLDLFGSLKISEDEYRELMRELDDEWGYD